MFVAVARVSLAIPEASSLKGKRHVVHKVLDKVRSRFNAAAAEVAENDLWQRATLGFAVVANERAFAQEQIDRLVHFVEELYVAPVLEVEREVIPLGGELYGAGFEGAHGKQGAPRTLAEAEEQGEVTQGWRTTRTLAEAEGAPPQERGARTERVERNDRARRGTREERPRAAKPQLSPSERSRAIEELRRRLREGRAAVARSERARASGRED